MGVGEPQLSESSPKSILENSFINRKDFSLQDDHLDHFGAGYNPEPTTDASIGSLAGGKGIEKNIERKILVLCSGTDSVGETLREMYPGCIIVNVDIDEAAPRLTHCVDILDWKYKRQYPKHEFYAIWASPVCTGFTRTQTLNPGPKTEKQYAYSHAVASNQSSRNN